MAAAVVLDAKDTRIPPFEPVGWVWLVSSSCKLTRNTLFDLDVNVVNFLTRPESVLSTSYNEETGWEGGRGGRKKKKVLRAV